MEQKIVIPRIGVGVLVIKDDKILLGKRKNAHGEGSWAPPGGHLEFGETIEQCAVRELLEETGLVAETVCTLNWVENVFEEEQKHYITFFVLVDQFSGKPKALEVHKTEKWEWFGFDSLPEPLFAPLQTLLENHDQSLQEEEK